MMLPQTIRYHLQIINGKDKAHFEKSELVISITLAVPQPDSVGLELPYKGQINRILPRDPQGLDQNGEGNRTSLASSVSVHAVTSCHRTSFQRRKRRIPQVKLVSLKQIQTLYLSAKAGPFLSQPSHTHSVKDDNRHRLSATESRRAERNTNRESVRKKRERRQKVRERVWEVAAASTEKEEIRASWDKKNII
ncbi:hypothetical protein M9H77_01919 [Catharanthus roseus]|uniref:Uncharacterized protein n=1 Tax=Catharanthus roseus TaxID=4058 RepID=A0ACC0C6Y1_CATRO|nr:hypothetical protein M9H77_01919 [Catharanthus roseus]